MRLSGEIAVERSPQRRMEGEGGLPLAAAPSAQDRLDPSAYLRRRKYGGRFGQRL